MLIILADRWWTFVVRGIAAILFGLLNVLWPGITLTALVLLFGVYALIDGVLSIVAAVTKERGRGRWWALILQGVFGIIAAGVTVVFPGLAALALLYVIAAWALVTGAFEVAAAISLRKYPQEGVAARSRWRAVDGVRHPPDDVSWRWRARARPVDRRVHVCCWLPAHGARPQAENVGTESGCGGAPRRLSSRRERRREALIAARSR